MPVTRRTLLVGGGATAGLVLAWGVWPRAYRPNLVASPGETIVNAFLKIGSDGHVAIVVPQAEMGQGVWTALPQILADELGADWRTVSVEPAPIGPLYANTLLIGESAEAMMPDMLKGIGGWAARTYATRAALMLTGGSSSIRGFEPRFREAGAMARALLCMAAGKRWDADWQACETAEGFVTRGEDRLRFAELAAEAATLTPPKLVPLRPLTPGGVGTGGIVGRSMPRLDLPAKVDGSARFAADVRLPDLVYASVRHGPIGSGALAGVDRAAAEKVPGVIAVIERPGWAAAVAGNWWAAEKAVEALAPRFAAGSLPPDSASVEAALRGAIDKGEGRRFASHGDLAAAFAGGGGGLKVEYAVPFAVHAAMEPLAATARITGDRLELWMPTQAPGIARDLAAKAVGFDEDRVTVYPMLIGGGFGRKIEHDAGVQAAVLAQALKRPVQVMWSRAEETMFDRMRPPARARMTAALGAGGRIKGWQAEIAAPATMASLTSRLMGASDGHGAEAAAVEGAELPYATEALAIDHFPADIGVPTGIWRSVAHSYTAFFTECFIDELARQAHVEPLSFRIQALSGNPRLAQCLTTVTALGGWDGGSAGSAQGLACHASFGSYVAMLAEAHIGEDQRIVVDRIVAAVDCGRIVNPEIVRQQIEGGIVWGIAAALGATTGYTAGRADARNFDALNLPKLSDMPEIRIELMRSAAPPGGVGEIAVPPVAPAIANALFAADGRRLRTLPLTAGGR